MKDPLVTAARRLAAGLAVFDVALGLVAIRRPALLRRLFGDAQGSPDGDAFYARWGVQILAYAAVQGVAAAFPTPGALSAVAALRAVEIPADLAARARAGPAGRVLLPLASAFNAGAGALFALAARRSAREP